MQASRLTSSIAIVAFLTLPAVGAAQNKSGAASPKKMPSSATAHCSDSSWSSAASQQGACSGHGGVAKWIGKKPRGATARCNDGEYWTTEGRQGACSGHGGVASWYGKSKSK